MKRQGRTRRSAQLERRERQKKRKQEAHYICPKRGRGCIAAEEKLPGEGTGGAIDRVVSIIASLGQTVMEHWQKESDEKFWRVPTPDKKSIKSEMAQTRLLEVREKRLKMEMTVKELEKKKQQDLHKAMLQVQQPSEVEISLSRTSHSVSCLGQEDRLDTAEMQMGARVECCAGDEYCTFMTEVTNYDRDSIFPELNCIKCKGKAHHLCIKLIVSDLNICFKCYFKEAACSGRKKKD